MNTVKDVKAAYDAILEMYYNLIELHVVLAPRIAEQKLSNEDLVDVGFFHREMAKTLDEMRKECTSRQELIGKVVAYRVTQAHLEDPSIDLTVRGTYASGTPDVSMKPHLPPTGSPEYNEICEALGFSKEAIDKKLAKLHWPHLSEYATQLAQEGKQIPTLQARAEPTTVYRKRS